MNAVTCLGTMICMLVVRCPLLKQDGTRKLPYSSHAGNMRNRVLVARCTGKQLHRKLKIKYEGKINVNLRSRL
jgi:hypothetical protein